MDLFLEKCAGVQPSEWNKLTELDNEGLGVPPDYHQRMWQQQQSTASQQHAAEGSPTRQRFSIGARVFVLRSSGGESAAFVREYDALREIYKVEVSGGGDKWKLATDHFLSAQPTFYRAQEGVARAHTSPCRPVGANTRAHDVRYSHE